MMIRVAGLFCCLAILNTSPVLANNAPPLVQVTINQQPFQFDALPRLADVIAPVALQQEWYWPATALYKHTARPEQLRSQLLALLNTLQQDGSPKLQQTLQSLSQQVSSWQLAERINQPVDYDLARVRPAANPAFTAGDYSIRLVRRPTHVMVLGAVAQPGILNHQPASSLAGYIQQISMLDGADLDQVVVISPGGEVQQLAVGYWQHQHTELMPGATMLVPLKPRLFNNQINELNSQLIELARHRVFP